MKKDKIFNSITNDKLFTLKQFKSRYNKNRIFELIAIKLLIDIDLVISDGGFVVNYYNLILINEKLSNSLFVFLVKEFIPLLPFLLFYCFLIYKIFG